MRYLDSNIIAYAFYENENREKCKELIKGEGIIDTFNLVEAYNIIQFETNDKEYAKKVITSLLKSNLKIIDVNINIIFEALKRVEKYKNLKFLDLVHYTVALLYSCNEIASYDKDFDNLEIKRIT